MHKELGGEKQKKPSIPTFCRLKFKENLDSEQNKIVFHLLREKLPVFSTNSSNVTNREGLFSQ